MHICASIYVYSLFLIILDDGSAELNLIKGYTVGWYDTLNRNALSCSYLNNYYSEK